MPNILYPVAAPGLRLVYSWVSVNRGGGEDVKDDDIETTIALGRSLVIPFDIALGEVITLWLASTSPATQFTCIWIETGGGTVEYEFTVKDGDVAEELMVLRGQSGRPPISIPSNLSRYAHIASDALSGTSGPIDKIRAKGITSGRGVLHLI